MIPELGPTSFVEFLAAMWEERGWETSVRERSDETYFVVGNRPDGKRGIIYVFPTTTSTVTERHLKKFVSFCKQKGIDVAVVATQGAFAEGAERVAAQRSIHMLDRSTLADTVEEGGLNDVLARFTDAGSEGVADRLQGRLPDLAAVMAAVYALVPIGGGNVATPTGSGSNSSPADDPAPASTDPDGLGIVAWLYRACTRPVPAGAIVITLLVAFVLGAVAAPAVGLGGAIGGGAMGGDAGPEVSAVSTAGGSNATVDVRWNARAAGSISVNGTTYDAPDGQTFLLVRMNVTNGADEPTQFSESALAADVAGTRYGHQPLDGVTGFPSAGLFEPGETREVWTVFAVPDDAESVTIILDGDSKVRFVRDSGVTPEASVE